MSKITIVQAVTAALRNELEKDKSVVLVGEDIGVNGGVFRATDGLYKDFPDRVLDTPLSEAGIISTAFGMSVNGIKTIAEIQFSGFMYGPMEHIYAHISRTRSRSRGRFNVPMVIRTPYGAGIKALDLHCESGESIFTQTTGLKMVIPSSPYDAKGLLISAIRDPDPVLFYEPMRLYRSIKEEVPDEEYTIPLGKANVIQEGSDLTVVSYGAALRDCVKSLANSKHSAEIIDLRTVIPFDTESIVNSVKKTGRLVVVHEAPKSCGLAAEIIARINEKCFYKLQAPPVRVTGFDTMIPFGKLENYYLPSEKRILKAVDKVMKS
jgi:pyruvate dehydrogenase E1 component beta subunit|tara:strand:- start:761 stop:1726 length:966 start_codon:yes stop_codon:yes gene_type:complete